MQHAVAVLASLALLVLVSPVPLSLLLGAYSISLAPVGVVGLSAVVQYVVAPVFLVRVAFVDVSHDQVAPALVVAVLTARFPIVVVLDALFLVVAVFLVSVLLVVVPPALIGVVLASVVRGVSVPIFVSVVLIASVLVSVVLLSSALVLVAQIALAFGQYWDSPAVNWVLLYLEATQPLNFFYEVSSVVEAHHLYLAMTNCRILNQD